MSKYFQSFLYAQIIYSEIKKELNKYFKKNIY